MAEGKFEVLTDRQHVRMRIGVYVGSAIPEEMTGIFDFKYQSKTVVPALVKCIEEIMQNSIDEYIRSSGKYANEISISIIPDDTNPTITIKDNGRGIPVEKIGDSYRPVLAWTELRAGSNFNDEAGRTTIGANGMGSSLVNILSKQFTGITEDGKKRLTLKCSNGMEHIDYRVTTSSKRGTTVSFVPDLECFGKLPTITQDHIDVIYDRLVNLSVCYPKINFTFNGQPIQFEDLNKFTNNFGDHTFGYQTETALFVVSPSGGEEEFRHTSYVNGIWMKNGGTHIDQLVSAITSEMIPAIKKKWKIDVPANQIKQHLLVGMWVRNFVNPRFDSQSKERLTNTVAEVKSFFNFDVVAPKIAKHIIGTPAFIDPIIAAILYKKQKADERELEKAQKQNKKVRVINHIAAQSPNPENRTLFLTEGLSAIGQLIDVRNPQVVGGFPLKGKPMNIRGVKPADIMKNKEMAELMSIIGLELNKPAKNLNYGKIAILTDSDMDGAACCCLLINFFHLWPELFEQRRIYRCETPLYICKKGKSDRWFYNKADFDKFDSTGYAIDYAKGLGSLPKEVYREAINNPRLVRIDMNDVADAQALVMAFGDDSNARKEWLIAK